MPSSTLRVSAVSSNVSDLRDAGKLTSFFIRFSVGEGDIVGIWGAGPIGQCAAKWALLKGAKKVVVVDLLQVS